IRRALPGLRILDPRLRRGASTPTGRAFGRALGTGARSTGRGRALSRRALSTLLLVGPGAGKVVVAEGEIAHVDERDRRHARRNGLLIAPDLDTVDLLDLHHARARGARHLLPVDRARVVDDVQAVAQP